MLEPPHLEDAAIVTALHAHYGLFVTDLTFLPLGADSASFVYRAAAGDATYFVKLRSGDGFSLPSLAIPHFLYQRGVPHVLAPLATSSGALWVSAGDYALSVYPFLEARTGAEVGLSEQHWRELGETVKCIHGALLPPELALIVKREDFVPSRRDVIPNLESALAQDDPADPVQREMAAFWRSQQQRIRLVLERADALGDRLRQRDLPHVLCHADLHTWNVLLDSDIRLWIVDWDEVVRAPKERDLMFVIGGIGPGLVGPRQTDCFLQGYGESPLDPQALSYYRYAWAVQDIAAYGEQALLTPDAGQETRRNAAEGFMGLFAPGAIVDIALATSPPSTLPVSSA